MVLLSKLAIIEDTTPDNVVSAPLVLEGGDGATRTGFSIEPVEVILESGQLYWPKADYQLEVAGLRGSSTDETQLDTWSSGNTDLILIGYGTGFIFHGRGKINSDVGLGEQTATWRFRVTKQAVRGYVDGQYASQMLLSENGFNDYLWGDADSDGVANGWSKVGTGTLTFSSGVQTIEVDENTASLEREIIYPFPGQNLTFSVEVTAYTNAAQLTRTLDVEYINAAGTTISTDTETFTGTGIKSTTNEVPASTHSIKFRVEVTETGTGSADISFKNPSLRNDGSTVYISR